MGVKINEFAGGAVSEKFDLALEEVLKNIMDLNTDHKTKRKLTIELTFAASEDRDLIMVDVVTKTKLAQPRAIGTKILIDRDGKGGIIANEYNNQIRGQQFMQVDEETGEIKTEDELEGIRLIK